MFILRIKSAKEVLSLFKLFLSFERKIHVLLNRYSIFRQILLSKFHAGAIEITLLTLTMYVKTGIVSDFMKV